jgi:hypothetical protein
MTDTILDRETVSVTDEGDHDLFAHYVDKNDATRAAIEGVPIMALCGKIWIPSRDPEKYPICPTCKEIYEELF